MIWLIFATVVIWAFANLPSLYAISRFSPKTFTTLWKFAPNQFFFDAVCVPAAALMCFCCLWWTLRAVRETAYHGPAVALVRNWPVSFLLAISFAALISAAFYFSTAWSPDKLKTQYAQEAVTAITVMEDRYASPGYSKDVASNDIARAAEQVKKMERDGTVLVRLPRLSAPERAQILFSRSRQRSLDLLDDTAIAISAFQIFAVVAVAVLLFEMALVLFMLGHVGSTTDSEALTKARLALFISIVSFVPYPYLFGVYRTELERLAGPGNTGGQDLVASIAIISALALLAFSERGVSLASATTVKSILAGVVTIVPPVVLRTGGAGFLRDLIGIRSNTATHVVLLLLSLLLLAPFVYMAWPETTQ